MFISGLGHNIIYYMGDEPPLCPRGEDPALKAGGAGSTPAIPLFIFICGGAYTASSISASGSRWLR